MRYRLAGREKLAALMTGTGALAGGIGLAVGLAQRAVGPLAIPLAVGGGLMWLGRTLGDGFVEISDAGVRIKLGALFDETIPLAEIADVRETTWRLLGGLGVRSNLRDMIAVVTATGPAAEIRLWKPRRTPLIPHLFHLRVQRLIVSPERLDSFISNLRVRLAS